MQRVAVFVDAGYLFAQGSALLAGRKLPRSQVILNAESCVRALSDFARTLCGVSLLRVYWYDGTSTGPTPQQLTLAHLDDVKLRLGFVNSVGEQKGVDSLIITDMITLARNRAISDAILLSGDEDLRVGVQQAQEFGVRVHLLGIKPSRGSQSLALLQESDSTHEWEQGTVTGFLSCRKAALSSGDVSSVDGPPTSIADAEPAASAATPAKTERALVMPTQVESADMQITAAAKDVALRLDLSDIAVIVEAYQGSGQIVRDVDRQLLGSSRARLGRELEPHEKKLVRSIFVATCIARIS